MKPETFTIPADNLPKLRERIGKLNKRAEKIGVDPIEVEVGSPQTEEDPLHPSSPTGTRSAVVREVVPVTITGKAPKVEGWQFVATLEHDEDGTIIRRIPTFEDEVDLSQYRDATPENCDHCGYKRKRNDTYIVAKQVGTDEPYDETKQVGSNCLKDFTGHESPQQIARFLEQVREVLEELRGGHYSEGRLVPRYSTRDYMARVVADASEHGWVSKKTAWQNGVTSTADAAATRLQHGPTVRTADYAWADRIIEWASNLDVPEDGDDYLHNVHVVLRNGTLTARQFGIAAGATQAYKRARADSFVGEVGKRVDLTLKVERFYDHDAYRSYVLRDPVGRDLRWSTAIELEEGATYTGSFRVRDHRDGNRKTTVIHYPENLEKAS